MLKRYAYFDNAKLVLIFLVVFGHAIQPFTTESPLIHTLYIWIYTFHMPAFIFLAGFFAKGEGSFSYIAKLAKKLLIPYIIFQGLYTGYYFIIGRDYWMTEHLFHPHWSLWFLLSLFFWHLLLIGYRRVPFSIGMGFALLIGIVVGYFDQIEHTFSLSRTFVFFPFFLLGYHTKMEHLRWLKKRTVKALALIVLVGVAISIYYLPNFNSGWLLASKSYQSLGVEHLGGLARIFVYGTSTLMLVAVLAWIPSKRMAFTKLGERTLYVYLLHGFIIQYCREMELFVINDFLGLVGMAFVSALIVYLLSSRVVITLAQPLVEVSTSRMQNFFQRFRHLSKI